MALDLASALCVQALTEPARRAALLAEAERLIDGLAPEIRPLHDTVWWRDRIREAQRGK